MTKLMGRGSPYSDARKYFHDQRVDREEGLLRAMPITALSVYAVTLPKFIQPIHGGMSPDELSITLPKGYHFKKKTLIGDTLFVLLDSLYQYFDLSFTFYQNKLFYITYIGGELRMGNQLEIPGRNTLQVESNFTFNESDIGRWFTKSVSALPSSLSVHYKDEIFTNDWQEEYDSWTMPDKQWISIAKSGGHTIASYVSQDYRIQFVLPGVYRPRISVHLPGIETAILTDYMPFDLARSRLASDSWTNPIILQKGGQHGDTVDYDAKIDRRDIRYELTLRFVDKKLVEIKLNSPCCDPNVALMEWFNKRVKDLPTSDLRHTDRNEGDSRHSAVTEIWSTKAADWISWFAQSFVTGDSNSTYRICFQNEGSESSK